MLARLLRPIVQLRDGETTTALLMFLYSFLAMTSYNIIKPISRSEFIGSLGADDLPYVTFAMGVMIGVIMQGYTKVIALVPRRWMIPVTQVGIAGLLLLFWVLFTFVAADWVAVAFYIVVADPRDPADQPVLDARQRRLRSAPGQAHLRLHRRRRQPRRRDGRGLDRVPGRVGRLAAR